MIAQKPKSSGPYKSLLANLASFDDFIIELRELSTLALALSVVKISPNNIPNNLLMNLNRGQREKTYNKYENFITKRSCGHITRLIASFLTVIFLALFFLYFLWIFIKIYEPFWRCWLELSPCFFSLTYGDIRDIFFPSLS